MGATALQKYRYTYVSSFRFLEALAHGDGLALEEGVLGLGSGWASTPAAALGK